MLDDPMAPDFAERLSAYHEAGHAVMAQLCGRHVTEVEIIGDREHTGSVQSLAYLPDPAEFDRPEDEAEEVVRRLKVILAGIVAEGIISGREQWDDSNQDLDTAVRLAMRLVDDCEDVMPLLEETRAEMERELRRHWSAVEMLAGELLVHKVLTGSEVRRLVTPHLS
ncbi:MAG: hypothetical protein LJE93_10610 [Acidobacteria bacterium]|jgi:hypothetical protein|nr:hypothetical protein [Acidobacteriota bacterium]